ncbi:MAG TPA: hypothetical protein VJB15_02330 [Rhodothermia bacterium]|nr:hypothetical protein [Rhodothermia bacterium]
MSAPETSSDSRRFVWPAEYYSGPDRAPVLPRGVTFGCGIAAVVVLALVFIGGAYLASGGFVQLMDLVFGQTLGEIRGMYTPDVTAAQKADLEQSIESLRQNMRAGKVSIQNLDPLLQAMRKSVSDKKVQPAEVETMTAAARKANRPGKK